MGVKAGIVVFSLCIIFFTGIKAQPVDSIPYNKKAVYWVSGSWLGLSSLSVVGLYQLWYSDYPQSSFHFFNDNAGWQGIDKWGHSFYTYSAGVVGITALRLTGLPEKKSIWYGGLSGWAYLNAVEVLDGFSSGWGFSPGDFIANTGGAALLIAQELLWKEQYITMKFGFIPSSYATIIPEKLGNDYAVQLLKDYNAQTYWFSFNINKITGITFLPKWLNLAVGYGANGMLTGYGNPEYYNGRKLPYTEEYKQIYIAPDIDLSKINVKNRYVRALLKCVNVIKFPLPTIEFNLGKGTKFYPVYF